MPDTATLNLQQARALINRLIGAGVRHAVISPGSRSTPLVMACEERPELRIWVQVDERCAAFFALGLARASSMPAILVATSGSAPAHWYPAVIEAAQAHVPMILLSADRPPELHHCGANQTTDQQGLFGPHLRAFYDAGPPTVDTARIAALGSLAAERSLWPDPGPVQINLPFREPLVPDEPGPFIPSLSTAAAPPPPGVEFTGEEAAEIVRALDGQRVALVCGPNSFGQDFAEGITRLAQALETPILADPLSGLRFGGHDQRRVLCRYDAFLRDPAVRSTPAEIILRFGAAPVSRTLLEWLEKHPAEQWLVHPFPDRPDPLHRVTRVIRAHPVAFCRKLAAGRLGAAEPGWFDPLREWEARAAEAAVLTTDERPFEGRLIEQLLEEAPPQTILFSGNSMPVRQFDTWSGCLDKPLRLIANRGVSGIDGNVSTLLGLAAGSDRPAIGLIGDLAFYHDMNGLLAARQQMDAVLIVINNGGGGIFGYLPQAGLEGFEEHWLTPTGLELAHAAKLYGLPFHRIRHQAEFRLALRAALEEKGVSLLEVIIDRDYSIARHKQYWSKTAG
ncbi:MAG TPA: 2-succinyl-5-enolpyruvyl-6-hydroxy-3-cyclohexene-1-carboxylic-acid synthase [Kiloniellaceae bacterium]|nr:2-succinyl-5-enolpyruvyl-6-hydroxy-3-cyclohexene-1-carboxylic-acid synthase [Kiloniellaceae bacterium]